MIFDLSKDKVHPANIVDAAFGAKIKLFYRTPTTQERIDFTKAILIKKNGKLIDNSFEAHIKYGAMILTGFESGVYALDGKLISSDPESPEFYPDWKDLIAEVAPHHFRALCSIVFDGVSQAPHIMEEESEAADDSKGDGGQEEASPLS